MIEASTEFKKSGYTDEQSLELGRIALLYSNIADEQLNAGTAANFMISQMKAFNIQAEDSLQIIDALNEVSNSYAVSSADLANAIGNVSATMAAGDTTYEQTLGLLTAITEITRNSNKSANALKTIGQRIRGVGEDGEDASEYVASLQEEFDKLGIRVQIVKNSAGEMESTYNILKGVAERWDSLTDAERQSLGELAAGKNRITEFNALMSNWQTAVEATTTAMNSQGSAAKENERVLDSIQGHIQELNSAWERLSQTMVDSDLVKMIVDLGTAFLNFANSGIGQFIIKASVAVGTVALLKAGYKALTASMIKYIAIQQLATKGITDFTKEANQAMLSETIATLTKGGTDLKSTLSNLFTVAKTGTKNTLGGLQSLVKYIGKPGLILLGLTAIYAIGKAIHNKIKEDTEEQLKRYEEVTKQLDEYKKRLEELQGYTYLSDAEKGELETLKEKVATLEKEKEYLKEIYETEQNREKLRKSSEAQSTLKKADTIETDDREIKGRWRRDISATDTNDDVTGRWRRDIPSKTEVKTVQDLVQEYVDLNKQIDELKKNGQDYSAYQEKQNELFNTLTEKASKYKEAYDLAVEAQDVDTATEAWNKYLDVIKIINKEEYNRITTLETVGDRSVEEYEKLNNIVKEYTKTKKLTEEQTKALIDSGMRSAIAFDDEGNAISLDTKVMWGLYKAKLEQSKVDLSKSINNNIALLKDEAYASVKTAEAYKKAYALKYSTTMGPPTKEEMQVNSQLKQLEKLEATINKIGTSTSTKKKSTSSSSSSSSTEKSWWEKQLDTLKDQYSNSEITIEEYIKALEKLLGKLKKGSDAWKEVNKLLQEQKLSKVESDYKRGVISLDEYIKKLQELIKNYKQGTKAWQDLADKIKEGLLDKAEQEQKDYEDAAKAATSIIDDEIKRLEELKDAKQKANDETERELELAKLQDALEKARNERTKRVYKSGLGKMSAEYKDNYIG